MADHEANQKRSRLLSRSNLILAGFLLVAGYFLWTEHRAHVEAAVPYLPYLLLLGCVLMHVFMHGGHGGHGKRQQNTKGDGES